MNCRGDDEGFYRNGIAEEILSLPAKDVLSYEKLKDPLSLLLNMEGALRNWKDVAGMLSYRPERILGDFVHHPRPGLGLLEDWIFEKKGSLRRLVQVFEELKLFSCLEVVLECVQGMIHKLALKIEILNISWMLSKFCCVFKRLS